MDGGGRISLVSLSDSAQYLIEMTDARLLSRGDINPFIADSWHRCLDKGLEPEQVPVEAVVSNSELAELRERNKRIWKFARPELESLFSQVAGTNSMVAFADNRGTVLDAILDHDFKDSIAAKAVVPGSVWDEAYRGTNALGLCLSTIQPCIVDGREHFFDKLGDLSCFASPVIDHNNRIVGIIDASTDAVSRRYHTLELVKLAGKNIENRLFLESFGGWLVLAFHARREYLGTAGEALLAVNEDGYVMGANANAKLMLNGLTFGGEQPFGRLFLMSFTELIGKLLRDHTITVSDRLGSSVFMTIREPGPLLRSSRPLPRFQMSAAQMPPTRDSDWEADDAADCGPVFEDPVVRKQLERARKMIEIGLPVLIQGEEGSGKSEFAASLHRDVCRNQPFVVVDGGLLDKDNYEAALFGDGGKLNYLDRTRLHGEPVVRRRLDRTDGKLGQAAGGTVLFENVCELPLQAQRDLLPVIDAVAAGAGRAGPFPRSVLFTTGTAPDQVARDDLLDRAFLNRIAGCRVDLPPIHQRSDFETIAVALLRRISPEFLFSKRALTTLRNHFWNGNIRQLRTVLQLAVANAGTTVLRDEVADVLGMLRDSHDHPCPACIGSPIRQQKCLTIRKVWSESGGNISLTSRKLGVSRTTIYAHIR